MKTMRNMMIAGGIAAAMLAIGCGKNGNAGAKPGDSAAASAANKSVPQGVMGDTTQQASEVKTYAFHGTVKKIDEANNMLTIAHEKIEGYMEAMTMPYKVADPAILKQVKVGDETHFTLRVTGDDALITKVQKGHDKGQKH